MLRRLVVGFDGTQDARAALRLALELAGCTGGEVAVIAVVPESHGETPADRHAAFEADAATLREQAHEVLAPRPEPTVRVTVEALRGDHPGQTLRAFAAQGGYDLVVVGRHGRGRAVHGGLGRVARELAERAGCPVLVVSRQDAPPG